MALENSHIFDELERNGPVIANLLTGLSAFEYTWREAEDKWDLLDVICHLYDEEWEDFRARVQLILEDPTKKWVKIDPPAWVKEHAYAQQSFEIKIDEFLTEREKSVVWLRSLENPKWDNGFQHPKVGHVSAQLILENWLAHDLLHIRQILRIKYCYLKAHIDNPLDYAGEW